MTGPEQAGPSDELAYVDLVPDELSLARGQLASGLPGTAEGVLRRYIARLEAGGRGAAEQLDVARGMLAEALWRQGRPQAADQAINAIRETSLERQRPIVLLIEAEAQAAAGRPEVAERIMTRVIESVGVDEAWRLRGGVPSRLPWPVPASLRPQARRTPAAPAGPARTAPAMRVRGTASWGSRCASTRELPPRAWRWWSRRSARGPDRTVCYSTATCCARPIGRWMRRTPTTEPPGPDRAAVTTSRTKEPLPRWNALSSS